MKIDWSSGIIMGMIPCISMILCSFLLSKSSKSAILEAIFQYYCAGLLVSAVALELVPSLLNNKDLPGSTSIIGVFFGFSFAIFLIHGVDFVVNSIENETLSNVEKLNLTLFSKPNETLDKLLDTDSTIGYQSTDEVSPLPASNFENFQKDVEMQVNQSWIERSSNQWEEEPVIESLEAMSYPEHRRLLITAIQDVNGSIEYLFSKIFELVDDKVWSSASKRDELSEIVDDQVHRLQYKIDKTRRILQGSQHLPFRTIAAHDRARRQHMVEILTFMRALSQHIHEHLSNSDISIDSLKEIHDHIDDMDRILDGLHQKVEKASNKWRRCKHNPAVIPIPLPGSTIPMSLMIPLSIDCMVDGFLIGLSSSLSPQIGLILGCANGIEMGFLGMAMSLRLRNCTSSSSMARFLALYCVPLLIPLFAWIGMNAGNLSHIHPLWMQTFLSFGIAALFYLACFELLIEARKTAPFDEDGWQGTTIFFAGFLTLVAINFLMG